MLLLQEMLETAALAATVLQEDLQLLARLGVVVGQAETGLAELAVTELPEDEAAVALADPAESVML